jgi:hypothetical protein
LWVYTTWFMGLMLLVFLVLVAWHLRPFNAARPLILLVTAAVLVLRLTNTGALIAEHNVQRYLDGRASTVDVDLLEQLGDPAVPALYRLQEEAADKNDAELERDTTAAIGQNCALHEDEGGSQGSPPADLPPVDWRSWTLASHEAARLHALHGR